MVATRTARSLPEPFAGCSVGSGTGGTVAKDALGNEVTQSGWLKTHQAGARELVQGLKVRQPHGGQQQGTNLDEAVCGLAADGPPRAAGQPCGCSPVGCQPLMEQSRGCTALLDDGVVGCTHLPKVLPAGSNTALRCLTAG